MTMRSPENRDGKVRRRRQERVGPHRSAATEELVRAAAELALSRREGAATGPGSPATNERTDGDRETGRRHAPNAREASRRTGTQEGTAPLHILLAEDDAPAREVLRELLEAMGHEVMAAVESGPEAVEGLLRLQPDVVLLDVHMPGGSGLDAAEEIASRAPGTAIVLISGDRELRLSEQQVSATTAHACLPKPVSPAALDATLRLADARSRAENSARGEARMRKRQLEQRKVVERAKGVMMRRLGCTEEQAYTTLRRTSQDRSIPLVEIALAVLDGDEASPSGRSSQRRGAVRREMSA